MFEKLSKDYAEWLVNLLWTAEGPDVSSQRGKKGKGAGGEVEFPRSSHMFTEHLGEFTGEILQARCEENSDSAVLFNKHPCMWKHMNMLLISYVQCYSVSLKELEVSVTLPWYNNLGNAWGFYLFLHCMSLPEGSLIMPVSRPLSFHLAVYSFTLKFKQNFVAFW